MLPCAQLDVQYAWPVVASSEILEDEVAKIGKSNLRHVSNRWNGPIGFIDTHRLLRQILHLTVEGPRIDWRG